MKSIQEIQKESQEDSGEENGNGSGSAEEILPSDKNVSKFNWNMLKGLGIGQLVCIVNATTYAMTNYLGQSSSTGTAVIQTVSIYWGLLIIVLAVIIKYGFDELVNFLKSMKWYYCIGITVCDILATLCVIIGIQMTNILSSQLISVCGIPFVLILSFFILKRRFHWIQLISSIIAIVGFVLVALSDGSDGETGWIGDIFCLASAFLFSVANTLQEKTVNVSSKFNSLNYVVILGTCGPLLSLPALFLLFLWPINIEMGSAEIIILCIYPLLQLFIYSSIAYVILFTSAAFFNISNLSSSIYGLIYDIALFSKVPGLLSILGAVLIFASVILFSIVQFFQ